MNEELLYFIWKFKLYRRSQVFDFNDKNFEILSPGIQNYDSGPDFSEAKLKTGDLTIVGNAEIDLKSSDWYKHKHHLDKAYNNVIFQVVSVYDKQIISQNGRIVPVLQLEVDSSIHEKYNQFLKNKSFVPCSPDIKKVDEIKLQLWLGNVLVERLKEKSTYISNILNHYKKSWEDTFYQLLARNFGFNVNSDPFEWLAKSLPLKILGKHHNNLIQIEALLYGQAGFLDDNIVGNEYFDTLKKEYQFLKTKYQLVPIEKHLWKFMRIRPSNFPTIRISQFANLIYKSKSLFSKITNEKSIEKIKQFFLVEASPFWDNHFHFENSAPARKKVIGQLSINEIMINTIVPILFVYGEETGDECIKERALMYLENLKPEKNSITDKWETLGIKIPSSFYSQALIHQKKCYCLKNKCLSCGIGVEIMKKQFQISLNSAS